MPRFTIAGAGSALPKSAAATPGDVVVADIHAVEPDLADGFLHVDGVPMHDCIECEAQGARLLFLPLLKRTPDLAAFAVVNAPAEAVTQFGVVELGQDAPAECRIVDVVQDVDRFGDPVGFGERPRQGGRVLSDARVSASRPQAALDAQTQQPNQACSPVWLPRLWIKRLPGSPASRHGRAPLD